MDEIGTEEEDDGMVVDVGACAKIGTGNVPPPPPPPPEITTGETVTVRTVDSVDVPFAFTADKVYAVVETGVTLIDPEMVEVVKFKGEIMTDEALFVFHERVAEDPDVISVGETEKEEMVGVSI